MVLYNIISEGFLKRRFKHSNANWILLLMFALGMPSWMVFTGAWFRGILVFVMIFIYGYYAGRKCMRERAVKMVPAICLITTIQLM
jgi:uridine phosphorylase